MATNNKLSTKLESQVPSYLIDEGPKLVAFLKAYYEFMEQEKNVTDRIENLLNYNDIDSTLNEFLTYFDREILKDLPQSLTADRRLVAKNIRDLYKAKGSEQSYKLLFRMLFNEEIEFYFPGEDILRASDGRWTQETILRVSNPSVGDLAALGGRRITGQISGATARVLRVESTTEFGVPIFVLYLETVVGTFLDNETVVTNDNLIQGAIVSSFGPLFSVSPIVFGGENHQIGDAVSFTANTGVGANGIITQTIADSLAFTLVSGGSGYTANATITITPTLGGSGAEFQITSLTNTEILVINEDTINPMRNVVIGTGPTFVSLGANTAPVSANLATANVSTPLNAALAFSNVTVGTIASISTTRSGSGYGALPTVTVIQENVAALDLPDGSGLIKGENAIVTPAFAPGSILTVSVTNRGTNYFRGESITISNLARANTIPAIGTPIVSGVISLGGVYSDTKGFLSWNNKLQDNFYYQEYSYLIRASSIVDAYREFVINTIHPAGMKLFGEVGIRSDLIMTSDITRNIEIESEPDILVDLFAANTTIVTEIDLESV